MAEGKKWYTSKMLWINALTILGALFTELAGVLGVKGTITLMAVVNIVLRIVTKTPLKFK